MIDFDKEALNLFYFDKHNDGNLYICPTKTSKRYINKHYNEYKDLFNYLDNKFDDLSFDNNLNEILYRIKNNIFEPPVCQICGNPVKFIDAQQGYRKTCSISCMAHLEHNDKIKNGFYENRKVNRLKNQRPELFYDWTKISKENDEYILKHFLRFNRKNICPDTNKLENGTWAKNPINKDIINYIKNRYNNDTIEENLYWLYHNLNEAPVCKVCGNPVKFINFVNGYNNTCSHSCKTLYPPTREKLIETNKKRYGVNFVLSSKDIQNKSHQTFSKRIKENYYNSPKSEISSYSSKGEHIIFDILKKYYPDILQYYRDKRYRNKTGYCWECDFYIPSIDLFIEYQGFVTHGTHPFNENDINDINRLKKLYERLNNPNIKESTKVMISAEINGWGYKDIVKRNVAKENNLKYVELFEKNVNKITEEYVISEINKVLNNAKD